MREKNPEIVRMIAAGEINIFREEVYFVVTIGEEPKVKDRRVAIECRLRRDPKLWVYRHPLAIPLGEINTLSIFGHDEPWCRPFMLNDVMRVTF